MIGENLHQVGSKFPFFSEQASAVAVGKSQSALLSLVFGSLEVSGKPFRAGGYAGDWLAKLTSEYFNRTGSVIVILTLIFLATIVSTQFSFGRLFAALCRSAAAGGRRGFESFREWREERRRDRHRRSCQHWLKNRI